MKRLDKLKLERLLGHCDMFLFASHGSPVLHTSPVASQFVQFGLLHLTATMFIITDKKSDPKGGVFHRILDPMGYGALLGSVDSALDSRIGKTTLKQFVRSKRNRMATHGDLSFLSQPKEVQNVTFSKRALRQFEAAMESLESAVLALSRNLEALIRSKKDMR